jgi:hypothetical protein
MPRTKKSPSQPPATITFRLDLPIRKKLKRRADEQLMSEQAVVTQLVADGLSKPGFGSRLSLIEERVAALELRPRRGAPHPLDQNLLADSAAELDAALSASGQDGDAPVDEPEAADDGGADPEPDEDVA